MKRLLSRPLSFLPVMVLLAACGDRPDGGPPPDATPDDAPLPVSIPPGGAEDEPDYVRLDPGEGATNIGARAVDDDAGGGFSFRVWAPHADAVSVIGDFNDWDPATNPLAADGEFWTGVIAEAEHLDRYLFSITHGGETFTKADPRAGEMVHSGAESVLIDHNEYAWTADEFEMPANNELVIYEMHIGTYNDAPEGGPGTFASAIERLDHLVDLGINAVEVMPVGEFAGDFSWGYNNAYPFAPDAAYGGTDGFKSFVDACHARGIAVLLDVVHNHYGPSDLSMWCFDGECLGDGNGGVYFYTDDRKESGWGPRPDYGRAPVRAMITDNTWYWLSTYGLDGLRVDSTVGMRIGGGGEIPEAWWLMQDMNAVADSLPNKLLIAEDLQNNEWLTHGRDIGGAGFDSQWDAQFFHPVNDAIIRPDDGGRSMYAVRDAILAGYSGRSDARVIYTESHDEVANGRQRIPSMIDPGDPGSFWAQKRSTLGAALVMTSPGIPMIFQGQEMLEDEWFRDTDPLDWDKLDAYSGIVSLYRDLIGLRRSLPGLKGGGVKVHHVNDGAKVIAFQRWGQGGGDDDVLVVMNFSNTAFPVYEVGAPYGGTWEVAFSSDDTAYGFAGAGTHASVNAGGAGMDDMPHRVALSLAPYTAVVLTR